MPNATETLGTGETYTTIQAWEDALATDDQYTGECKAEVFTRVTFSGRAYTATDYPHLTVQSEAEHDGRAHEVSDAGNARIEYVGAAHIIWIRDPWVRVSWLEVKGPGDNNNICIYGNEIGTHTLFIHHNICHNNHANADSVQSGINFYYYGTQPAAYVYRNIVYGMGIVGIDCPTTDASSIVFCNTVFECNNREFPGNNGIKVGSANWLNKDNASFEIGENATDFNNPSAIGEGLFDYNASADASAEYDQPDNNANSIANLTTADQFVNPTTTWADTDLLLKVGADLIDEGTSFDPATYPEIDVSIDKGATRATIDGTWDIGASEYVSVGEPPVGIPILRRRREAC